MRRETKWTRQLRQGTIEPERDIFVLFLLMIV